MGASAWNIDWRAARARAPDEGVSLLRHERNQIRCERVGLTAGLALCQVEGRCDQALTFEAPAANEPRAHWQFLGEGAGELLDARCEHALDAASPTLFSPPHGRVAWRLPRQPNVHVISLDVTASALQHWCDAAQASTLMFDRQHTPVVLPLGSHRLVFARLRALLSSGTHRGPVWRLQCESLALQALAMGLEALGLAAPRNEVGSADLARLNRARDRLVDGPAPPVTMLALAKEVGMPLRRLQRLYADRFGEPLKDALQRARLESARQALLSGNLSIKQIAWQAGYAHPTSFTHAFKAHWGHAPSELTSRRPPRRR